MPSRVVSEGVTEVLVPFANEQALCSTCGLSEVKIAHRAETGESLQVCARCHTPVQIKEAVWVVSVRAK